MSSSVAVTNNGFRKILVNGVGPVATIAIAQLFGTALWFSANSTAAELMHAWGATEADIGWLTSAVQLGFILGTLGISLSGAADRFRASTIFVYSAIAGSLCNLCFAWLSDGLISGALFRFCVGICLAGIYPVGMKLIVGWAPDRAGLALAQLVAMLTLGTALPHAIRIVGEGFPWQLIITASSLLALFGAGLISLLGDGPHAKGKPQDDTHLPAVVRPTSLMHRFRHRSSSTLRAFRINEFRAAALGYFGHMWELYAFWTVVPLIVSRTSLASNFPQLGVSGLSFCVIGVGALGSILGGMLSQRLGSAKVALGSLVISGGCGLVFVLGWQDLPIIALLVLLIVWGASVVADSPQFSALSAKACPPESVGSALAIQNGIGFAITVVSISATTSLIELIGLDAIWLLLPGPVLGFIGFTMSTRRACQTEI
jgi:MFS family permease